MAVIDEDKFSNISWTSEQSPDMMAGPSTSSASGAQHYDDGTEGGARASRDNNEGGGAAHPNSVGEILECIVSDPRKENDGTKDAYVSYRITTNTTFSTFQRPTTVVRRRFTDFVFLYKVLTNEYQAAAVPPLPDKQRMEYVTGDRFSDEFKTRRGYSLQRFLSRLALHPDLRRAKILHNFLESPDWNATMRSRSTRGVAGPAGVPSPGLPGAGGQPPPSAGVFDSFADSLMNAFTKVNKPDRRFVDVKEKSDKLEEDLGHVEKVIYRLSKREENLETDLHELAEQFKKLITLEPGVQPAIQAFSASVEDTATGLRRLKEHTELDYLGSLRDMAAYSGALKNLLKAREQKQLDFEQLVEYLNKSTADRDALAQGHNSYGAASALGGAGGFIRSKLEDVRGVDHEQARRDRQRKLELRVDDLTREVESARTESERFSEQVVKEVESFDWIKKVEFKRQLGGLADSHIEFYNGTIDIWEKYVAEMEREGAVAPA